MECWVWLIFDDFAVETGAVIRRNQHHDDQISSVIPDPGRIDC